MNWPMKPLSELCLLAVDCVNKTAPVIEGPTPFKMIRTTNVKRGFIDIKTVRYVSENTFKQWTRRSRPLFGDVILTREAPVGEVGRCTFDGSEQVFLGQRLFQYRPDPALLDWNYLAFALQSPQVQNKLHGMSFGATVPHIKVGDAEHLGIPYPPLATQQAIGGLLASYDDLIETNLRRITLLEESARLLYREWFVKLRFPGALDQIDRYVLPEGWLLGTVGNLASLVSRGITPRYDDAATGLVINQKCIRGGRLTLKDARRQSKEVKPERLLQVGDVLVNSTGAGTLGRVAQVRAPLPNCTVDTHVTILRPINPVNAAFFGLALLGLEPVLSTMGVGSTNQLELARADIAAIPLAIPPDQLRLEFHDLVWPFFMQMETLAKSNARLVAARDALLPKLMSGELAV